MKVLSKLRSKPAKTAKLVDPSTQPKSFSSVSIVARSGCEQAKHLAGKRFLVNESPRLPLDGCNKADCNCVYRQHSDRRAEPRRAQDVGVTSPFFTGPERRSGADRRTVEVPQTGSESYFDYFSR